MANIDVSEVKYQSTAAKSPMWARIYRPAGDGPLPALVSVHGGAWIGDNRTSNQILDVGLAERGITIMAIDFRIAPQDAYPASIVDINLAVRWLKNHASRYATRAELVGGVGTSSGGHQLLMAAMRPNDPRYNSLMLVGEAGYSARLASMVLCWPIVDPVARYGMAKAQQAEDILRSQEAYFVDERTMDEADPLRCLLRGERLDLPPALIVDGVADDRLTPRGIDQFISAYARAGGRIGRQRVESKGHMFSVGEPHDAASIRALDAIAVFVHAQAETQAGDLAKASPCHT